MGWKTNSELVLHPNPALQLTVSRTRPIRSLDV
jgi:hypothetical protein